MSLDGVNGNTPIHQGGNSDKKPKVIGKLEQGQSIFTVTKKNDDGSKSLKTYYKDFNGDGEITEDEISHIDKYEYKDGKLDTVRRYKDTNHDGYSNTITTYKYDENRKLIEKKEYQEEDESSVKSRPHFPWELHNRRMDVLNQDNPMMMRAAVQSEEAPATNASGRKEQAQKVSNGAEFTKTLTALFENSNVGSAEGLEAYNKAVAELFDGQLVKTETYRDGGSTEYTLKDGTVIYRDNQIFGTETGYITITRPDGTVEKYKPDGERVK